WLRELGLSPAAAIAAASSAPREALGLPGLRAGAPADVVIFAEDPRRVPAALARPAAVLVGGRRVV
ncbi:MAG TPA: hypothetical protein VNL77_19990, partial [Roseiflexaceae bacterium]|nr:hypothetical protein [Roseiflexaceae bacterium]